VLLSITERSDRIAVLVSYSVLVRDSLFSKDVLFSNSVLDDKVCMAVSSDGLEKLVSVLEVIQVMEGGSDRDGRFLLVSVSAVDDEVYELGSSVILTTMEEFKVERELDSSSEVVELSERVGIALKGAEDRSLLVPAVTAIDDNEIEVRSTE
jgi:hypothetical protein